MSTMIPTIPTAVAMTAPSISTAKAANNNCANSGENGGRNSGSGEGSAGIGTVPFYRVRQSWDKKKTQIAAFTKLENAKNCVD
ncbi:MAG: hypothetical protein IJ587_03205, partial [Synergistaceae bacterium]|nr:hypothetical protein [Synergistaceae bacterium]